MKIKSKWLRLTEEVNALDYLERAGTFIRETEKNMLAWKWVVLSLHGALYGFAVCACRGTSNDNVIEKSRKGEMKLISFDQALKRCQDPRRMNMLVHSQPLVLSDSQKDSIRRLKKELRNNIEHYTPCGWSIEIHGMPEIAIDSLSVIRFLAVETHTYSHLSLSQIRKIKSIVFQSKGYLMKTKLYKEGRLTLGSEHKRNLIV